MLTKNMSATGKKLPNQPIMNKPTSTATASSKAGTAAAAASLSSLDLGGTKKPTTIRQTIPSAAKSQATNSKQSKQQSKLHTVPNLAPKKLQVTASTLDLGGPKPAKKLDEDVQMQSEAVDEIEEPQEKQPVGEPDQDDEVLAGDDQEIPAASKGAQAQAMDSDDVDMVPVRRRANKKRRKLARDSSVDEEGDAGFGVGQA